MRNGISIPALVRFAWRMLTQSYTYRFVRFMRNIWRERLTRPGQYVVAAAVTSIIAGSLPEVMAGSYTFSAFISLVLLSLTISILARPKGRIVRQVADRCVAGATVPVRITVTNTNARDLSDLSAFEFRLPATLSLQGEPLFIPRLRPGETHSFEYPLATSRRGSYLLPGPTLLSSFPFGLTQARRFEPAPHRLVVYPAFRQLTQLDVPVGQRYQPGGIVLTSNVGESMEFVGTREYQAGDRLRDLHPRSWARVGFPVVRQYQEEFLTRVALFVDTFIPPRTGRPLAPADDLLEANLSMAAAITDYLARQEYIVDLFAAGPELYYFQAGRSLGLFENVMDILACIERCPRDPLEVVGPRFNDELRQVSTVIVLLLDWEPRRQNFVRAIQRLGVQVKTIVVSDTRQQADVDAAGPFSRVVTPAQVRAGIETL
ncbi:MAG: DUF58 domain-containing protein [Planctomycetota bacterium]|nr:DUF58 domain-containing protein [Planctomycetota bacterium]